MSTLVQEQVARYLLHIEEMTSGWPKRWGAAIMDRLGSIPLHWDPNIKEPYTSVVVRCGHRHKTKVAAESCGRALFKRTVRE